MAFSVDDSSFKKGVSEFEQKIKEKALRVLDQLGNEILRLSSFEVPHDTGMLQASGTIELHEDYVIVGYNKVYAAHLHEHPEYHFQKGRKGKYLEDPIKNNLVTFRNFIARIMEEAFG